MSESERVLKEQLAKAEAKIKKLEEEALEKKIMDRVASNLKSGHDASCGYKGGDCKKCDSDRDYY